MPGRPANLDNSRARTYCACNRYGWGCLDIFFSRLSFLSFFSLSLGDGPIYTAILPQRTVKPKPTNKPFDICQKVGQKVYHNGMVKTGNRDSSLHYLD